ncbi:hypothetical protein EVAR_57028_1 [Eumeta japonica]|uniref:Uncharacterized protein n=1 Tax=Eumeta variegata TaxID=151549 RepID=A0A4C2AB26_EUMVA|nr:hypothetical protein EVAR_57028_1 [Eumeta japonica]
MPMLQLHQALTSDEDELLKAFFALIPGQIGNGSLSVRGIGLDTDDTFVNSSHSLCARHTALQLGSGRLREEATFVKLRRPIAGFELNASSEVSGRLSSTAKDRGRRKKKAKKKPLSSEKKDPKGSAAAPISSRAVSRRAPAALDAIGRREYSVAAWSIMDSVFFQTLLSRASQDDGWLATVGCTTPLHFMVVHPLHITTLQDTEQPSPQLTPARRSSKRDAAERHQSS